MMDTRSWNDRRSRAGQPTREVLKEVSKLAPLREISKRMDRVKPLRRASQTGLSQKWRFCGNRV